MLRKYRKRSFIHAEQFDGSDEMVRKYRLTHNESLNDLVKVKIYFDYTLHTAARNFGIDVGDYIATDENGSQWVVRKDDFEQTYELVEDK